MKNSLIVLGLAAMSVTVLFTFCTPKSTAEDTAMAETPKPNYGGFESREKWGEHLVTICGCHDCHTPKMMTDHGPDLNPDLLLSGHPSSLPAPDANRKEMESKGLIVTNDLTTWIGPWGVSFTANLTSDATGIGNWQESNFITAMRHGKFKGIESGRSLLPPMPWQMFKNMTDDELMAIFAYLKTTKPINNIVPEPLPPMSAPHS